MRPDPSAAPGERRGPSYRPGVSEAGEREGCHVSGAVRGGNGGRMALQARVRVQAFQSGQRYGRGSRRAGNGRRLRVAGEEEAREAPPMSVEDELQNWLDNFSYERFDEWLQDQDLGVKVGQKVRGPVVAYEGNRAALVDIGGKSPGIVRTEDLALEDKRLPWECVSLGDELEYMVAEDGRRDPMNRPKLSRRQLLVDETWQELQRKHKEHETARCTVTGLNRGGALVKAGGVGGFVPGSHLTEELEESLVGKELDCLIMDLDRSRNRLILSNRLAEAERKASEFHVGDVVEGKVVNIKPYGAFVDVGGITGLLHRAQITEPEVQSAHSVFSRGDRVKCLVLSYEAEKSRLTLSTRKLEPSPGDFLSDPAKVEAKAEEMASQFRQAVNQSSVHPAEEELESAVRVALRSSESPSS